MPASASESVAGFSGAALFAAGFSGAAAASESAPAATAAESVTHLMRDPPAPAAGTGTAGLFVRVDLGLLEPARVVNVDGLPLGEDVEASDARLAMPVAGVLDPAE